MTQVTKPIEKGNFVINQNHPEHGIGRVVATTAFATRVLFLHGGVRVFRTDDNGVPLKTATPLPADVEALALKEAAFATGVVDTPTGPPPKPAPKAPRAKKPKTA